MKKLDHYLTFLFVFLTTVMGLMSCSKSVEEERNDNGKGVLTVKLGEADTRAVKNFRNSGSTFVSWALLNADNKKVVCRDIYYPLTKGEETFNKDTTWQIRIEAPVGKYILALFSSSRNYPVQIENGGIVPLDSVSSSGIEFYWKSAVEIKAGEDQQIQALLRRCTTGFYVKSSDRLPADIETMECTLSGVAQELNILTGEPSKLTTFKRVYRVNESYKYGNCMKSGQPLIDHEYFVGPSTNGEVSVHYVFYDRTHTAICQDRFKLKSTPSTFYEYTEDMFSYGILPGLSYDDKWNIVTDVAKEPE